MWQVKHWGLKTKKLLFDNGIISDARCGLYGATLETALHTLEDCRELVTVWKTFLLSNRISTFSIFTNIT